MISLNGFVCTNLTNVLLANKLSQYYHQNNMLQKYLHILPGEISFILLFSWVLFPANLITVFLHPRVSDIVVPAPQQENTVQHISSEIEKYC